jgi:hypothetical protein
MLDLPLSKPSFYAHSLNGLLVFISVVIIILNFTIFKNLDIYKRITILLLVSIAIGIHGISHLGLEYVYNFDPLNKIRIV